MTSRHEGHANWEPRLCWMWHCIGRSWPRVEARLSRMTWPSVEAIQLCHRWLNMHMQVARVSEQVWIPHERCLVGEDKPHLRSDESTKEGEKYIWDLGFLQGWSWASQNHDAAYLKKHDGDIVQGANELVWPFFPLICSIWPHFYFYHFLSWFRLYWYYTWVYDSFRRK